MVKLAVGDVVHWAQLADAKGRNAKFRPVVVLAVDFDAETAIVCAVTTTSVLPLPRACVPLSWSARGDSRTKLRQKSWVVANWIVVQVPFVQFDIERVGHLSKMEKVELLDRIKEFMNR